MCLIIFVTCNRRGQMSGPLPEDPGAEQLPGELCALDSLNPELLAIFRS